MNEYRLVQSATRWRVVSIALGLTALLLLLGVGIWLPWYWLIGSMASAVAMFLVIYSKLQFSENVPVDEEAEVSAERIIATIRSRYPDSRIVKTRATDIVIKTSQSALHDIRISIPLSDPRIMRVTSTPPARGELGMQPMRSRIREWVEIVETLRSEFGAADVGAATAPSQG